MPGQSSTACIHGFRSILLDIALQNLTLDPRGDFGKNSGVITNKLHRCKELCDVISDQAMPQASVRNRKWRSRFIHNTYCSLIGSFTEESSREGVLPNTLRRL